VCGTVTPYKRVFRMKNIMYYVHCNRRNNEKQNTKQMAIWNRATRKLLFVFYHVVVLKQRFDGENFVSKLFVEVCILAALSFSFVAKFCV
jgi:hypothetical protein